MSAVVVEPRQHFDLVLGGADERQLGALHRVGAYWIWAQTFGPQDQPLRLLEWTSEGVADLTTAHYSVHVVKAGAAHHIAGLFGYWLVADADHVWVQAPRADGRHYVLIAGGKTGVNRTHALEWYCQACGSRLGERRSIDHDGTPASFLRAQTALVERFNATVAARTCPACGAVHPPAADFQARPGQPSDAPPLAVAASDAPAPAPAGARLARLADLREDAPTVVTIANAPVALIRRGDSVHAISQVCPHRGGPLGFGNVQDSVITCPWHRFRFDLATGRSLTNPALCAKTYSIEIIGGWVMLANETTPEGRETTA